jgi:hypothetical protein
MTAGSSRGSNRTRWEVELLLKRFKSTYHLDQIPTSNPVAVEALVLIALISLVVSRVLLDLLREIVDREAPFDDGKESSRIPPRRWPSREPSSGPTIPDSSRDDPTS